MTQPIHSTTGNPKSLAANFWWMSRVLLSFELALSNFFLERFWKWSIGMKRLKFNMDKSLFDAAKEYVAIIEQIEQTKDAIKLQELEEKRVKFHWEFIDLLKKQGIPYKDRDHATRIAMRIAKGEL